MMKKQCAAAKPDLNAGLDMLKYFYAHINYAGRIHRGEDQVTLNTILDDLINEDIAFTQQLDADPANSHHGFPAGGDGVDYYKYFDAVLPAKDSYELYGFNWTIESELLKNEVLSTLTSLHSTQRKQPRAEDFDIRTSIEMSTVQASLKSASSGIGDLLGSKGDGSSLLNMFCALQVLLSSSSLGSCDIHGAKRYDH